MKEIEQIVSAYQQVDLSQQRAALATVVEVEGSSYRRAGARMFITEKGVWVGGISGGCLEGDALRKAKHAMLQQQPTLVTYDTREDDAHQIGVGLGCNGLIKVLIAPLNEQNTSVEVLKNCLEKRQLHTLITLIDTNSTDNKLLGQTFHKDDFFQKNQGIAPTFKEKVGSAEDQQRSTIFTVQHQEGYNTYFIEVLPPPVHLLLFGGNYDVLPLVQLAKNLGWKSSVICNPSKVNKSLFQLANAVVSNASNIIIDEFTAAVVMAHDYKTDLKNLSNLLQTNVSYLGVLGPKKRSDKMLKELLAVPNTVIDDTRIYAPVGLDIGANSPEEISLSILAEIRAVFSNRKGQFLKERQGTIHERT